MLRGGFGLLSPVQLQVCRHYYSDHQTVLPHPVPVTMTRTAFKQPFPTRSRAGHVGADVRALALPQWGTPRNVPLSERTNPEYCRQLGANGNSLVIPLGCVYRPAWPTFADLGVLNTCPSSFAAEVPPLCQCRNVLSQACLESSFVWLTPDLRGATAHDPAGVCCPLSAVRRQRYLPGRALLRRDRSRVGVLTGVRVRATKIHARLIVMIFVHVVYSGAVTQ